MDDKKKTSFDDILETKKQRLLFITHYKMHFRVRYWESFILSFYLAFMFALFLPIFVRL